MLKEIPVDRITCLPNYRTIGVDPNDQDFKDLVASVTKDGVHQSGLVRPHKNKPDYYQLVFGNRRFAAALAAGLATFPATVKDVADDDILELQVMENLQRKDVHPMDEAAAFKAYQEKKKVDVKELAAVFAKTERYITNRLQLNNLISELQKHFLKGLITVGQAEIFARCDAKQQNELMLYSYNSYENQYVRTPEQLKKKIEEDFLLKLNAAPWKRDDAELYPQAGACSSCEKRSSCKGLLFADMVKDDRCTDKECYAKKKELWFTSEVEKVATTKPDVKFVYTMGFDSSIKKLADKYSIDLIRYYDVGISTIKSPNSTAVKAFWISGHDAGKYVTLYIANKSKAAGKASKNDNSPEGIKMQTAAIQQRLERAKELDYEKVQERIVKAIEEVSPDDTVLEKPFPERKIQEFLAMLAYDAITWADDDLMEKLGIGEKRKYGKDENPHDLYMKIFGLNDAQMSSMLRNALMNRFRSSKRSNLDSYIIRQLAESLGINVAGFVVEQNEAAAKRESNAAKRIEALKKPVSPAAKKVAPGANKTAPAAKKAPKKVVKKSSPKKKAK